MCPRPISNGMNKIIWRELIFLFVIFAFAGIVSAQGELLFGQHHAYSVVFRGNGEAIVYARLALTNSDDKPLTNFSFEIPKVTPSEMVVYQVTYPKQCVRYGYEDGPTGINGCVEYREPDFSQNYYYGGATEYKKITYTKSGTLYSFDLPNPVSPQKGTVIVVAYAAKGYVSQSLGRYQFNFETIKVPSRIEDLSVAVDVDSDLLLKGKQSSVNYGTNEVAVSASLPSAGVSSKELDSTVQRIGSYGALMKNAKNLAPNESFVVRGEYADNWFALYLPSILITVLIIIAIFAIVYFLAKFLKKRKERGDGELSNGRGMNSQELLLSTIKSIKNTESILNLANLGLGLLSVFLVFILSYLVTLLDRYGLFYRFNFDPVFVVVGFIVIVILYVLVILGPAIILATKRGWKTLIYVLVAELLWFALFFMLYIILFSTGMPLNRYPKMYYNSVMPPATSVESPVLPD